MEISKFGIYNTFVFDCDGVILDSNQIKSQAFYELAISYGKEPAEKLVDYHKKNGGVSRHRKLEYFYRDILGLSNCKDTVNKAIDAYGRIVSGKLLSCPLTAACEFFLTLLPPKARKIVISGGLESELNYVFKKRGLAKHFNGIYGSPRSKEDILKTLKDEEGIVLPAIFFGDSSYDHYVSMIFDMDFVFVSGYSEFDGVKELSGTPRVRIIRDFGCILPAKKGIEHENTPILS